MSDDRPPPSRPSGGSQRPGGPPGPRPGPPRPKGSSRTSGPRPAGSGLDLVALRNALRDPGQSVLRGQRFDRYELLDEIARGAMGVVIRARHTELGAQVALKLLAQADPTPEAIARFRREARVLAQIKHTNVVGISDLGEERGIAFLAMELIEGPSLQGWVEEVREAGSRIDYVRVVEIMAAVAKALAHCHSVGAVHRDVKPHNILIERETGRPVLTDFGLVKRERAGQTKSSSITGALEGQVVGTPSYMSPEQFEPGGEFGEIGPKSDVYGLGAVLYYCLTGQPPFAARNLVELYGLVTGEDPLPPSELRIDVPKALDDVTLACLRKTVDARISMEEVVKRLEALLAAPRQLKPRGSGASRAALIVVLLLGFVGLDLAVLQPEQGRRLLALVRGERPAPSAAPASATPARDTERAEADLEEAKRLLATTPPETAKALLLLERAGQGGAPAAWVWLGQLYAEGRGVAKDEALAKTYFSRGAREKNPTAMLWLGVFAREGRAGARDERRAVVWFRAAAEASGPEHAAIRERAQRFADELEREQSEESPAPAPSSTPAPPSTPAASSTPDTSRSGEGER